MLGVVCSALLAAPAILAPGTASAATALIIGTTFLPDPTEPFYWHAAQDYYVTPTTVCGHQTCSFQPVLTPEQFWPASGPDDLTIDESIAVGTDIVDHALRDQLSDGTDPIVLFGDSQSSSILTMEKRELAGLSETDKDRLTFVMVANPNRPNGGLLNRLAGITVPIIDLTGTGATPTNTGINTIDIAFQYDGIADFPRYPLNLLADLNILAGAYIHSSYSQGLNGYTEEELINAINDPANQQTYGDTTYVTIPAKQLPLLIPLRQLGEATGTSAIITPFADLIEPTLRVLVELGYDRSIPYGQPTGFGLFPHIDPRDLASDLAGAAQQGVNAALVDLGVITPPPAATPPKQTPDVPPASSATVRPARQVPARAQSAAAHTPKKTAALTAATPTKSVGEKALAGVGGERTGGASRQAAHRSASRHP